MNLIRRPHGRFCWLVALTWLTATAVQAEPAPSACEESAGSLLVECLRTHLCPKPQTDAQLAECYRNVALHLAGEERPVPQQDLAPQSASTELEDRPPAEAAAVVSTPTAKASPPIEADPEPDFGLSEPPARKPKKQTQRSVSGIIVLVQKQPRGTLLIGLDNGQLWEENEPSRATLREGQKVKINRRLLGAYKLTPETGRSTAVHRLACAGEQADPRCRLLPGRDQDG